MESSEIFEDVLYHKPLRKSTLKISILKDSIKDIKMPLNTLKKDRSKHFSGRAARLASCLPVYSDRVKRSRFFVREKQKFQVTI